MNLPKGVDASLDAKLEAAESSLKKGDNTAAKKQLTAFVNEVNAQSGKKMSESQAAQLSSAAITIIDHI